MKIIPFTKENYPHGYSRKDARERLARLQAQQDVAKELLKRIGREIKDVSKELKQGGIRQ
jgi:hypothetical protein